MPLRKRRVYAARSLGVPPPPLPRRADDLLAERLGSRQAAESAIEELAGSLGLRPGVPTSVLSALALTALGDEPDRVAEGLDWEGFEDYCAGAIGAAGYSVKRNVRMRKPTRQIDIVAESPSLILSIDCKRWARGSGESRLRGQASAQTERTRQLVGGLGSKKRALPVILTMLDNRVRVVDGVPVVPLSALRDFLASVNPYDQGFAFV